MARTLWLQGDSGKNSGAFLIDTSTRAIPVIYDGSEHTFNFGLFHYDSPLDLSSLDSVALAIVESQTDATVFASETVSSGITALITTSNWNNKLAYNFTATFTGAELDYSLGTLEEVTLWMVLTGNITGGGEQFLAAGPIRLAADSSSISGGPTYMLKSVYDTDNDGIVERADLADAVAWANITGTPAIVYEADFNANTVLAATTNDTPVTVTLTEETVLGRQLGGAISAIPRVSAGEIAAGSETQVRVFSPADVTAMAATGTNLGVTGIGASTLDITSSTGTDATVPAATGSTAGLATAAQIAKLNGIETAADVTDATNVNAAGAVMESDFDANTVLAAAVDDTPLPVTIAENDIVGRLPGGAIGGITKADLTEETTPTAGHWLMGWGSGGGDKLRRFDVGDLPGMGGSGTTNLSITNRGANTLDIASSTGADVTVPAVTTSLSGLMTGGDKSKLDTVETNADVTDATNVNAAGAVMEVDFNANTILAATTDNTPTVRQIDQNDIVGRLPGGAIGGITLADLIEEATPVTGDFLLGWESGGAMRKFNVGNLSAGSGGGSTDLAIANRTTTTLEVTSSTGNDAIVPAATTSLAGLLVSADKTKLDGIETGADVTDATNVNAAGAVMENDFNANTILAATGDNTPLPIVIAENDIVGRLAGGAIGGITFTDLTLEATPASGDLLWGWEAGGALRAFDVGDLPFVADGDTLATGLTFPYQGFHLLDVNASHDMIVRPGSDLTADRTLTISTGDNDRTINVVAADLVLSAAGAALIDDADAATQRATMGANDASNLTTGTIPAARVGAAHIDAITEIAAGLKTGSDAKVVTGTAGTNGNLAQWDANGDAIDSSIPASWASTYVIEAALTTAGAAIATGTKVAICRVPFASTLNSLTINCDPANEPSAAAVQVDLNEIDKSTGTATTVLSAVAQIATSANEGTGTISTSAFSAGDILSFDIDQGSDGKELIATLQFTRTA